MITKINYSCIKSNPCTTITIESLQSRKSFAWKNYTCSGLNDGFFTYTDLETITKEKSILTIIPNSISITNLANLISSTIEEAKILLDNRTKKDETVCSISFGNVIQTTTIQRNNCAIGYIGSNETITIAANTFKAATQIEANNLAINYLNNNKQNLANAQGTCTPLPIFYNVLQTSTLLRSTCPINTTPSNVTVNIAANSFQSYVSQIDADNKAIAELNRTRQSIANIQGVCTPITYTNTDQTFTANCGAGKQPSSNTSTVSAGTINSYISQIDADNQALNLATQQAKAGLNCIDIVTYRSVVITELVQKNNCSAPLVGSSETISTTLGQFTSLVSQADADLQATTWFSANKQTLANTQGKCIPGPATDLVILKFTWTAASSTTVLLTRLMFSQFTPYMEQRIPNSGFIAGFATDVQLKENISGNNIFYAVWCGSSPNITTTKEEFFVIDFKTMIAKHPKVSQIKLDIRALWDTSVGTGAITIQALQYSGLTLTPVYSFTPSIGGGTLVNTQTINKSTTTVSPGYGDATTNLGTSVGTLTYDTKTKVLTLI
jgi:hypothetical protein